MNIDICYFNGDHHWRASVMHSIDLLESRQGVLLLFEGGSIPRRSYYPDVASSPLGRVQLRNPG